MEGLYYVVKTKLLISCMVTPQLICAFVFAYLKAGFLMKVAQIKLMMHIRKIYHFSHKNSPNTCEPRPNATQYKIPTYIVFLRSLKTHCNQIQDTYFTLYSFHLSGSCFSDNNVASMASLSLFQRSRCWSYWSRRELSRLSCLTRSLDSESIASRHLRQFFWKSPW